MVSQRDAYAMGKSVGESIGRMLLPDFKNRAYDDFLDDVLAAEENGRQYSPFEVTASEFNRSRDPDAVWDAYERGVQAGAKQVWQASRQKSRSAKRR